MNPDNRNDIRTKDLIAMAFLKTKYWGLFRDIEANRDLYTQIRPEDRRASWLFDHKDEREHRGKHFNELFEGLGYGSDDIQLLHTILRETFPDWQGEGHISEDELRSTDRIGHRDLLDLYFSYGIEHQTFKKRMEHVRPIIERIAKGKYTEDSLMEQFKEFNGYALGQDQSGDIARLLARRLLSLQQQQRVPITIWRCWLRALLQYESGANESTNAVLASILSGANESIRRSPPPDTFSTSNMAPIIDQRVNGAISLFEDITKYLSDPYLGLLLLLFVFPPRGNSFFLDYIDRHGTQGLYLPVLNYVDNYFIVQKHNVFRTYADPGQWQFVLYQWSMSISQGNGLNVSIEDAPMRHRAVNDYIFKLLGNDPKQTYQFIRGQFWNNDDQNPRPYKWNIVGRIEQYNNPIDRKHIIAVVRQALTSKAITTAQREELIDFDRLFSQFISENPLNSIEGLA